MKRPFYVVGFAAPITLALAGVLPLRALLVLLAACVLGCAVTFFVRTEGSVGALRAVLLSASAALCLFIATEGLLYRPLLAFDGTHQQLQAEILEVRCASDGKEYYIARVQEGALPTGTQMYLYTDGAEKLMRRDSVSLSVRLQAVEYRATDDLFLHSAKANGLFFYAWQYGPLTVTGKAPPTLTSVLGDVRDALVMRMHDAMPPESAALTAAVILGDKSGLSDATETAFRQSGITHLLVVSGLHMSLVSGGIYLGLRRLRLSRRAASLCALVCAVGFALLVGLSASVSRALLCNAVMLIGNCFRRRPDARNSLGLAMTVLLAYNCYAVYDIGLLLSFGAAWGLIVLFPYAQQWIAGHVTEKIGGRMLWLRSPVRLLLEALGTTLCATLPILPLMIFVFGEISLVAPLTNVLTVFPSTVMLWSGAAGLLLSLILEPLGIPFWFVSDAVARYMNAVASWLGSGVGVLHVEEPFLMVALYACMVLCLFGFWRQRGRGVRIAAVLSVVLVCASLLLQVGIWSGKTELTAADADGRTVTLLRHGQTVGAIADGSDKGFAVLRDTLYDEGRQTLDFVLVIGAVEEESVYFSRLMREFEVDRWVFTDAAAASAMPSSERLRFGSGVTLHREVRASVLLDGFVRVECGEVSLLYCPAEADAQNLSAAERKATLLLLGETCPANAELLSARAGLWFGDTGTELPQKIACPVYRAANGTRLYARGETEWGCSAQPIAAEDNT